MIKVQAGLDKPVHYGVIAGEFNGVPAYATACRPAQPSRNLGVLRSDKDQVDCKRCLAIPADKLAELDNAAELAQADREQDAALAEDTFRAVDADTAVKTGLIAPEDKEAADTLIAAGAAGIVDVEVTPAKVGKPRRRNGGRPCSCGCGTKTGGGTFLPGHDARHASNLAKQVLAGTMTQEQAEAEAGSDRLAAKVAGMIAKAAAK